MTGSEEITRTFTSLAEALELALLASATPSIVETRGWYTHEQETCITIKGSRRITADNPRETEPVYRVTISNTVKPGSNR